MFDYVPVETKLKLGRPENRRYVYSGDKRRMAEHPTVMGPDAHGVHWLPVRAYYDDRKNQTLVVFSPIHPDDLKKAVAQLSQETHLP